MLRKIIIDMFFPSTRVFSDEDLRCIEQGLPLPPRRPTFTEIVRRYWPVSWAVMIAAAAVSTELGVIVGLVVVWITIPFGRR